MNLPTKKQVGITATTGWKLNANADKTANPKDWTLFIFKDVFIADLFKRFSKIILSLYLYNTF